MRTIKACAKRIIVREIEQKDESKSILILPSKKDFIYCEVWARGSEVDLKVEILDIIIVMSDSGIEFEIGSEKFLAITENQVIAILTPDKNEDVHNSTPSAETS
jgi:co-chaperonin GroES (HSP10)